MKAGVIAGKLALVTGGGSGIGRAVCSLFAREGAKVIVTDQNVKAAEDTVAALEDSKHIPVELNVKNVDDIEKVFTKVKTHFSMTPTIVVNGAGIINSSSFLKMNEQQFFEIYDVNLKGTFFVMQTAAKAIIASETEKEGSIINIGSITGITGFDYNANYAASKAAIHNLTKSAALELSKFGIRVNAVAPGLINTPMIADYTEKNLKPYLHKTFLKRMGKPDEVAELILFLASTRSSYINGATIEISGGYS